jgi:hypothetical protein
MADRALGDWEVVMTLQTGVRIAAMLLLAAPLLGTSVLAQPRQGRGGAPAAAVHRAAPAPRAPAVHAPAMHAPAIRRAAPMQRAAPAPRRMAAPRAVPHRAAPSTVGRRMAAPHAPAARIERGRNAAAATARTQQRSHQRAARPTAVQRQQQAQQHQRAVQQSNRRRQQEQQKAVQQANQRRQQEQRASQQQQQKAADRAARERRPGAQPQRQPVTTGLSDRREGAASAARSLRRNPNFVAAPRQNGRRAASTTRRFVLRNPAFAKASERHARALTRSTFHGRFADAGLPAGRGWRWHRRAAVIGWVGPVFWPYGYSDFVDYTYYPYAYDAFWPYAYDDIYDSMFGPYAYGSADYAQAHTSVQTSATRRRAGVVSGGTDEAQVCTGQAGALTDWPIERISQVVEPDEQQRAALDDLKTAAAKAIDVLQSACPEDLPSTPTGRLEAMRTRLEAMRQAVQIVRPALDKFYQSLNDEQKERFNALGEDEQTAGTVGRGSAREPDLTKICSSQAAAGSLAPIGRIERALHPTDAQRAALNDLDQASRDAARILDANCPQDESLTPPGRLAAMEQRLDAMLKALATVQPALEKFYSSLTDEQKAAFDRLNRQQG